MAFAHLFAFFATLPAFAAAPMPAKDLVETILVPAFAAGKFDPGGYGGNDARKLLAQYGFEVADGCANCWQEMESLTHSSAEGLVLQMPSSPNNFYEYRLCPIAAPNDCIQMKLYWYAKVQLTGEAATDAAGRNRTLLTAATATGLHVKKAEFSFASAQALPEGWTGQATATGAETKAPGEADWPHRGYTAAALLRFIHERTAAFSGVRPDDLEWRASLREDLMVSLLFDVMPVVSGCKQMTEEHFTMVSTVILDIKEGGAVWDAVDAIEAIDDKAEADNINNCVAGLVVLYKDMLVDGDY